MKKTYIAFILLSAIVLFSSLQLDEPNGHGTGNSRKSAGPPSCYAGEPPNLTTCAASGCHDGFALNSGSAQLNLDLGGADNTYTFSQQYTVTVSLSRTGLLRGGFQIIAMQDNNISTSPGIITLTQLTRTQRVDAAHPHTGGCATQNKVWIEHTSNGIDDVVNDTISWQFNWQAPSTDVGTITFYLAAVDADVDLDNTGDYVYSLSKTITATPTSIVNAIADNNMKIFPNPASNTLNIQTDNLQTAIKEIRMYDMTGCAVFNHTSFAINNTAIDVSNLSTGLYFLHITSSNGERIVKKIVKE